MDAQQITGLCISMIGAGFLFRRFCARGVAGYTRNNTPYRMEKDSTLNLSNMPTPFWESVLIIGGYVFFA